MHEREVAAVDYVVLDSRHERLPRHVRLRGHHEPGGVHVEAMDNAQAIFLALNVAEIVCTVTINERVHERAVAVVVRWMTDETSLLRQHDHVVVFVADVELDRLADSGVSTWLVNLVDNGCPA